MWFIRENIREACRQFGYTMNYDVSLQIDDYYKLVDQTRDLIKNFEEITLEEKKSLEIVGYGNIGVGLLRMNVSLPGHADIEL